MSLTSVPSEIRVQIWRLLLTRPCPVDVLYESRRSRRVVHEPYCTTTPRGPTATGCEYLHCIRGRYSPADAQSGRPRWSCVGPMFSTGVLLVCKVIYEEAVKVLYEENRFMLNLEDGYPPLFDFLRVRSLHLLVRGWGQYVVQRFREASARFSLHPEVKLTITARIEGQEDFESFAAALQPFAPVKMCNLSLGRFPEAEKLALKLLEKADKQPVFPHFTKLPRELRYHILSFTDLVQDYVVWRGNLAFIDACCRKCCETLFGCCCMDFTCQPPDTTTSSTIEDLENVYGSRFSKTCRCKLSSLPLLKISSDIQQDALRVLFCNSSFHLIGHLQSSLDFFKRIDKHLRNLRKIIINMDSEWFEDWQSGNLLWIDFIDYIEANLQLPLLSLEVQAVYSHFHHNPLEPSEINGMREFYGSFISGFQRLAKQGLRRFSIGFAQPQLIGWKRGYEQEVLTPITIVKT